jgi:hypothetical protein
MRVELVSFFVLEELDSEAHPKEVRREWDIDDVSITTWLI